MEPEIVVSFFKELTPLWVAEPVEVELLRLAGACPFAAKVGWDADAGAWLILAPENVVSKRQLLCLLFHELAHVKNGDAPREWVGLAANRRAMLGLDDPGTEAVNAATRRRLANDEYTPVEDAADVWADAQTQRFWPLLEQTYNQAAETAQKRRKAW